MKKTKKIIILIFTIFCAILPSLAEEIVSHTETGVVQGVQFIDTEEENYGQKVTKQLVKVKVLSGAFKGEEPIIENIITNNPAYDMPVEKGDRVILHVEPNTEYVTSIYDFNFNISDYKRDTTLIWGCVLFLALLIAIGKMKGFLSFIAIGVTVGLILFVLNPIILLGFSPIISSLIICIIATIVTIYLVAGLNRKSTSAVLGTVVSLFVGCILSIITIKLAHLTGFTGEESTFLYGARPDLDFEGILVASMMLATLGAVMDVGVSIASTINEIYETDNNLSLRELYNSGMNVGKDIIGTMSNTLILVYLGSSLPLVLLSSNIDLQKFFNLNHVASEIAAALIGSLSILICIPLTAIISAYLIKNKKETPNFDFQK